MLKSKKKKTSVEKHDITKWANIKQMKPASIANEKIN